VGRRSLAAVAAACVWAGCNIYTPDLLSEAIQSDDGGVDASEAAPDDSAAVDVPGEDGCAPGFGRCGLAQCTVQFAADPKNCGACGHDCQGAPCLGGACQPILVAGQQSGPAYVALDDTAVYWTNSGNGTVWRANKDGGGRMQLAGGQQTPWVIAVRRGQVYWSQNGSGGAIVTVPATGGVARELSGPQPSPRGLAIDDSYVYFVTEDPDAGTVQRMLLDGGDLSILASDQQSPKEVVLTPAAIFWSNPGDGTIMRLPMAAAGVDPTIVASGLGTPFGLATDGTFLYWTSHPTSTPDAGAVGRASFDGKQKQFLASAQPLPRGIAVDATYAYFTNEVEGTVKRVPVGGGTVVTLASGQVQPWGIALDDTFVYWAARGGGNVLRVAK
jgi:hypothetical protein